MIQPKDFLNYMFLLDFLFQINYTEFYGIKNLVYVKFHSLKKMAEEVYDSAKGFSQLYVSSGFFIPNKLY